MQPQDTVLWCCGASGAGGYLVGGAGGYDASAVGAGAGAEVDDVVGLGDDAHVQLDHDDGVATHSRVCIRSNERGQPPGAK